MLKVQRLLGATLVVVMSASGASASTNPCWVNATPLYEAGSGIFLGCKATGEVNYAFCGINALMPVNDGSCYICIPPDYEDHVQNGSWGAFWGYPDLTCHGCTSPGPFVENLYGWWDLDERNGSLAKNWVGYSGTHYGNPAPVPGKVNYGLQFDGVDDYVEVPDYSNLLDFPGNFTIVAWIKFTAANLVGVRPIVEKRQQAPLRGYSFYLYRPQAEKFQLALQLADGSGSAGYANYGSTETFSNKDKNISEWHLVAVSVNRSSAATFYVDGHSLGAPVPVTATPLSIANSSVLRIGRTTAYAPSQFKGVIDEVMMFDRALSESEINSFLNAGVYGMCRW